MRLWKVFWLGGAALAALSFLLHGGAERAFLGGAPTIAALSDVTRLLLLLSWFFVCWKHAGNVSHKAWTYAARAALLIALAGSAILY